MIDVLGRAHLATWGPDDLDGRMDRAEEVLMLAESAPDWRFVVQGRLWRMSHALEAGRAEVAKRELRPIQERAERTRMKVYRSLQPAYLAMFATLEGELDRVESLVERYVSDLAPSPIVDSWQAIQLFALRWEQGRLDEHAAVVEMAVADWPAIPLWRAALALTQADLGRTGEARQLLDDLAGDRFRDVPRDQKWFLTMWCLSETVTLLGDRVRAEALYDLLEPFADRCFVDYAIWCGGSVARALGGLACLLGRFDDAERYFAHARQANTRIGARPATVRTRYEYAAMLHLRGTPGDRERALGFAEESQAAARELGMKALEDRAVLLRRELARGTDTTREAEFRRSGSGWAIHYDTEPFVLPDSKGLAYLAHLLARPGSVVHAAELVAALEGAAGEGRDAAADLGHAGEVLDARARAEYRERLRDLESELGEATAQADLGRAERARAELDFVTRELVAASGLGGRSRRGADVAERVRKAVTNRIRSAIERIAEHDPGLAGHLTASIRTGKLCAYEPPDPVRWSF